MHGHYVMRARINVVFVVDKKSKTKHKETEEKPAAAAANIWHGHWCVRACACNKQSKFDEARTSTRTMGGSPPYRRRRRQRRRLFINRKQSTAAAAENRETLDAAQCRN